MMTPPPCLTIKRAASWATKKAPVRLIPTTRFHSSGVISRQEAWRMLIPALLMSTSTPPMISTALAKAAGIRSNWATSQGTKPARPGTSLRSFPPAGASRSNTQTWAPSSTKRRVVASPMPLAPPVITTRLPLSPRIAFLLPG